MNVFLTLTVAGLVGLFMMAMPAFRHHGHAHPAHGGGRAVLGCGQTAGGRSAFAIARKGAGHELVPADTMPARLLRLVPSPRALCRVSALYGAFGNGLVHAGHLRVAAAALVAVVPALLVERFLVKPVWNLLFRFQGQPSSPLEALLLSEARAVVPFRNGRGLVSVVRDGRVVQLAATLIPSDANVSVAVGDRLRVEDVDARRERVTVSVRGKPPSH